MQKKVKFQTRYCSLNHQIVIPLSSYWTNLIELLEKTHQRTVMIYLIIFGSVGSRLQKRNLKTYIAECLEYAKQL